MSDASTAQPFEDGAKLASSAAPTSACETVKSLCELAWTLEGCGLLLDWSQLSPDAVEQVLITDERVCDCCTTPGELLCQESGAPHKRRLVRTAQEMLRLLGRRVGTAYTRSAGLSDRLEGNVRVRTQRRIRVNPQLFLLIFYSAASAIDDTSDSNSLLTDCAQYLLSILSQIRDYGQQPLASMDEKYAESLLKSFSRGWQQYLKHSERVIAPGNSLDLRASSQELLRGTTEALFAAAGELASDPGSESMQAFVELLLRRVERLASADQLAAVIGQLERIREAPREKRGRGEPPAPQSSPSLFTPISESVATLPETGNPLPQVGMDTTPQITYSRPPLMLTDVDTSGSDGEGASRRESVTAVAMGPELPPNWYVDETGRSRPLPGSQKRERYLRLEFKARKAYEAALNVSPPKSDDEKLQEEIARAISEAQLSELAVDLNRSPPILDKVPGLLRLVERSFIEALPRRLQSRLQQEFRDVRDWNIMKSNMASVSRVLQYVVQQVINYGSLAREAGLQEEMKAVCDDIENASPDVGTAVAQAFRFLFRAIHDLRSDIAQFTLMVMSKQLKEHAVEYVREFVDGCLPKPTKWSSTITFMQNFINDERVVLWTGSAAATALSASALKPEERRLRGAMLHGTLDLIRSSGNSKDANHRWDNLPVEAFYFEKSIIFKAANSVQECTLLMLLEGTVSSVIYKKGFSHAQVAATLKQLHKKILSLLSQDVTLAGLKQMVIDFLDDLLCTDDGDVSRALSESERAVVVSTIDKMTDTGSALYTAFEKKVVLGFQQMCAKAPGDVRGEQSRLALGLVTDQVVADAELLRKMLTFNWEVYAPFYRQIIPVLTFSDQDPQQRLGDRVMVMTV